MAVKAADQVTVLDLTDGLDVDLSTNSFSMTATATNKLNVAKTCVIVVNVARGNEQIIPTSVTVGTLPANVTASVGTLSTATTITVNFGADLAADGSFEITVGVDELTYVKTFSYSIAFKGATGSAAYQYVLNVSPAAVVKAEGGTLSPASISLSATRASGTGNPAAYSGRFKVEKSADGETWSNAYTSSANESSKSVDVPSGVKLLRCSLYLAGGTTTLLDTQTVPIVSDGQKGDTGQTGGTGAAGADAYTVILTNESHTFAAGVSAALASNVAFKVIAYKGATQVNASVTQSAITGTTSGKITAAVTNNASTNTTITVSVTASLTTKQGVLTIPVVVDGKTFNKEFSWSLAMTGATGDKGDKGDAGDDAITLAVTSSNGNIFKNTAIATTLTAHVYQAGAELNSTQIAALGSIKWYKDGGSTAVATGATLTISAGDVTNRATYVAQLEG
ncbi:MAG: hypothetical protein IKR95_03855 [Oscillospiraceae bacterium]|nr:hypothetical protein [Oscillospiraceae bacterium]